MRIKKIKETCLYVRNFDKIRAFYRDIMGLQLFSDVEGSHLFFRAGESVLLCFHPDKSKDQQNLPPHYAEGDQHFAFEVEVDEYPEAREELLNKGVEIEHDHVWPNGLKSFYFRDPENNSVEIVQEGIWG